MDKHKKKGGSVNSVQDWYEAVKEIAGPERSFHLEIQVWDDGGFKFMIWDTKMAEAFRGASPEVCTELFKATLEARRAEWADRQLLIRKEAA
jgi:hypothetical protein